jgi:hypothetical protein
MQRSLLPTFQDNLSGPIFKGQACQEELSFLENVWTSPPILWGLGIFSGVKAAGV